MNFINAFEAGNRRDWWNFFKWEEGNNRGTDEIYISLQRYWYTQRHCRCHYDIIERVFSRMETRESVLEDRRVHYSFLLRYTNVNILSSSLIPIVRREWLV